MSVIRLIIVIIIIIIQVYSLTECDRIHCGWFDFLHMKGSVKEPNKFHDYETEKITRKASDVAEYIELFGSSTRDRRAWHI